MRPRRLPSIRPLRWAFGPRQQPLSAAVLLGGLWLAAVPAWTRRVFAAPLDAPLQLPLVRGRVVEHDVAVRVADRYQLALEFPYGAQPDSTARDALRRRVGGFPLPPHYTEQNHGVGVPLRWSLRDARTGALVSGGDTSTFDAVGWSAADIERGVASVRLPPGAYRLRVEVLQDVPAFVGVPTRVTLGVPSKSSESGVVGLAWWASLLTLVVWPVMAIAMLSLTVQAVADTRAAWRRNAS